MINRNIIIIIIISSSSTTTTTTTKLLLMIIMIMISPRRFREPGLRQLSAQLLCGFVVSANLCNTPQQLLVTLLGTNGCLRDSPQSYRKAARKIVKFLAREIPHTII